MICPWEDFFGFRHRLVVVMKEQSVHLHENSYPKGVPYLRARQFQRISNFLVIDGFTQEVSEPL